MVDDPSCCPDLFPTDKSQDKERKRLFGIIEELVKWENITNETIEVKLVVLLPVAAVLPGTGMTGSAGLGLTADPGGAVLMSLAGTPIWQALIDGVMEDALYGDPREFPGAER